MATALCILSGSTFVAAQTRVSISVRMALNGGETPPLPGAVVRFVPDTPGSSSKPVVSATTDLNGFAAVSVPSGQYAITISAIGFEALRTTATYVGIDSALNTSLTPADPFAVVPEVRTQILSLGTSSVSGRLLTIDGAPLLGATVLLSEKSLASSGSPSQGGTTHAEDGTFQINGVIGRRCLRVFGVPGGWRVASIEYTGRDITYVPVDFELGQDVRVNVLLVPGEPLPSHREPRCNPE